MSLFKEENSLSSCDRGVALLFVVAVVAVLSALSVGIVYEVQRSVNFQNRRQDTLLAKNLAELGVKAGVMLLKYDWEEDSRYQKSADYYLRVEGEKGLSALMDLINQQELWSLFAEDDPGLFFFLGLPGRWIPVGNYGNLEITITDLSARYNIHRLYRPQGLPPQDPSYLSAIHGFTSLLGEEKMARIVVDSLIDWMDPDSNPMENGAEEDSYRSLNLPYLPRNGPFASEDEILKVRGVTPLVYNGIISYITVYPSDLPLFSFYKINVNTAHPEVLLFLDPEMDRTIAEGIVEERNLSPFLRISEVQDLIANKMGKKEMWERILKEDIVAVRSCTFEIRSIAHREDVTIAVRAILDRDPLSGEFRIVAYQYAQ